MGKQNRPQCTAQHKEPFQDSGRDLSLHPHLSVCPEALVGLCFRQRQHDKGWESGQYHLQGPFGREARTPRPTRPGRQGPLSPASRAFPQPARCKPCSYENCPLPLVLFRPTEPRAMAASLPTPPSPAWFLGASWGGWAGLSCHLASFLSLHPHPAPAAPRT